MAVFRLEKNDCLLLIIDLQEKLMRAMEDRERVYKNTNLLIAVAEQFNIPIYISEQYPAGLGSTVEEIKNKLNDYNYIEKTTFSICTDENNKLFRESGKKTIIVCGSETHICVFQTVRDLIEQGYDVYVVGDAVCSRYKYNYYNGLDIMKEVGAFVSSTETVIFDLLKQAGTAEFKIISPLLK